MSTIGRRMARARARLTSISRDRALVVAVSASAVNVRAITNGTLARHTQKTLTDSKLKSDVAESSRSSHLIWL